MRIYLPQITLVALIAAGCARSFDPALCGPLTFSFDVQHGEEITHYSGAIPAEETAEILRQLIPRGERHNYHLMQEATEATLEFNEATVEYNSVRMPIKWTRVKAARRMFIFRVRGGAYVLEEPHSLEFEKLLQTYGTEAQTDPTFDVTTQRRSTRT